MTLIIISIALLFLAVGLYAGAKMIIYILELKDQANSHDVYCFDCQIEMPVKEYNGKLFCDNCGLRH